MSHRPHVVTAGFDPLLDEGEAYADRLREAGVPVEYRCEEGLIHAFANMGGVGRSAPAAIDRIAAASSAGCLTASRARRGRAR